VWANLIHKQEREDGIVALIVRAKKNHPQL